MLHLQRDNLAELISGLGMVGAVGSPVLLRSVEAIVKVMLPGAATPAPALKFSDLLKGLLRLGEQARTRVSLSGSVHPHAPWVAIAVTPPRVYTLIML